METGNLKGKRTGTKKYISVYVRNKTLNASGYYRLTQYLDRMRRDDIVYRELAPDRIYYLYHFRGRLADKIIYAAGIYFRGLFFLALDNLKRPAMVIVNREICPRYMGPSRYVLENNLARKTKMVWDFDDSIDDFGEITKQEWNILEKNADEIILLSDLHRNKIKKQYWGKVHELTTTDGGFAGKTGNNKYREKSFQKEIRLIWVATASSIPNLQMVFADLEKLAKEQAQGKRIVLVCVCNKPVDYRPKHFVLENILWSRKAAMKEMLRAHIGIMPLYDNTVNCGKGGFKLIQYLAAGLPVAGSAVGINKEILTGDVGRAVITKWDEAIADICFSWDTWLWYSRNARAKWEKEYSYDRHLAFWERIMDENWQTSGQKKRKNR